MKRSASVRVDRRVRGSATHYLPREPLALCEIIRGQSRDVADDFAVALVRCADARREDREAVEVRERERVDAAGDGERVAGGDGVEGADAEPALPAGVVVVRLGQVRASDASSVTNGPGPWRVK